MMMGMEPPCSLSRWRRNKSSLSATNIDDKDDQDDDYDHDDDDAHDAPFLACLHEDLIRFDWI